MTFKFQILKSSHKAYIVYSPVLKLREIWVLRKPTADPRTPDKAKNYLETHEKKSGHSTKSSEFLF